MSKRDVMVGELEPPAHTVFWYAVYGWARHHELPRFVGWPPMPEPESWEPFFRAMLKAPDWAQQFEHWATLGMRGHGATRSIIGTLGGAMQSEDMRARLFEALGYFAGRAHVGTARARRLWEKATHHDLIAP